MYQLIENKKYDRLLNAYDDMDMMDYPLPDFTIVDGETYLDTTTIDKECIKRLMRKKIFLGTFFYVPKKLL